MTEESKADGRDDLGGLPPISYVWQTPIRKPKRADWDVPAPPGSASVTPAMRAKIERIVSRAPEVMVKITGRTKGIAHLKSHLEYITRNGELAAETEQGVLMAGRQGLRDLQNCWTDDVLLDKRRANGTLSVNIILSMPPGTDAIQMRDAARAFAMDAFEGQHDYVFVLHQDDVHPHVHLTVRSCGYDGRRLNPRKADLHHWRECFARELRLRGVAAEATPRRTRGKVRKADRGVVRAIKERGTMPRVEQLAREEVVREAQGAPAADRPWEVRIPKRQTAIRQSYLDYAAELSRSTDLRDIAFGRKIEAFVQEMPASATRRHELRRELAAYAKARESEAQRETKLDNETGRSLDSERER